jgi:MoxR-like ATPase
MAKTTELSTVADQLQDAIGKVYVGKKEAVRALLIGFFSGLHVLIEDIPGVGKTTLARTFAKCTGLDFGRIQFTPDLLPGDVTGMTVWSPEKREFIFKEGAIMHQFILADEINRASARTQASLLEAMQEGSVTIDGTTYPLQQPFFVIATQNPISFAGTFVLPEGQVDRFGVSVSLGYPGTMEEVTVLERFRVEDPIEDVSPVTSADEVEEMRHKVRQVFVDQKIQRYLTDIANRTRANPSIRLGMSPRASQHLMRAAQGRATLEGRDYVIPEDVVATAPYVLPHRLLLTAEARMENIEPTSLVERILAEIPKPSGL